ncbi:hypothetical protein pb186bvf_013668 [Paramecium bursaria]
MEQKSVDTAKPKNQQQRGIPNPFPKLQCKRHLNQEVEYIIVKKFGESENPYRFICQLCLDQELRQYQGHVCHYKRFFEDPTTVFEYTSYKNNALQLYCDIKKSFQLEVTEEVIKTTIKDLKASVNQQIDDMEKLLLKKHQDFYNDQQNFVKNSFEFIKIALDQEELKKQIIDSKNYLPGFKRETQSLEKVSQAINEYVLKLHQEKLAQIDNIQKLQEIHDKQKTFLNYNLFSQIKSDAFNVLGRISNIISDNYFPTSNLADDYVYTELNTQMKIKQEHLRQKTTLIHRAQQDGFDTQSVLRNLEQVVQQNPLKNLLIFLRTEQDFTFGAYITKYQFKDKQNLGQNTDEGFLFHLQKRQFYNFQKINQLKIEDKNDKKQFLTFGVRDIVIDENLLGESEIGSGTDISNFTKQIQHPLIYIAGQTRYKLKDFEIFTVDKS